MYSCYQTLIDLLAYTVTVCLLGRFPSIASFFFRQLVHRKGPSHGFDPGAKNGPELTEKQSPGVWSEGKSFFRVVWTAHL
ncbi:unnamed protein product [Linum trigynum]|uniref:Uncharacterized protein n=1 Tax=Linum trigynum TaxID=586398 RepID=A0AAV2GA38_9ROSI